MASPEKKPQENNGAILISNEECLGCFTGQYRPYQKEAVIDIVSSLRNATDSALILPTGTGKTIVFLSVAIAAANKGYRVAILVATNQIIDQVKQKYLPMFKSKIVPSIVKGIENYLCNITGQTADYGFCTPSQKEKCKSDNPNCEVLRINRQFESDNFILTNYHKFLSVKLDRGFDLVIIDDSHGFENAVDDKFQNRIAYYQVDSLFKRNDVEGNVIGNFTGNFLDLFDDSFNAIPPDPKIESIRMPNDIVKGISDIECYKEFTDYIGKLPDELDRSICRSLSYFVNCCQNTSINTFYVQKDHYNLNDPQEAALIARKSDRYQRNVVRKTFGKAKVIFASATISDIITHANYCTFRDYDKNTIVTIPEGEPLELKGWFNGLEILEAQNFPQGSKDPIEATAYAALELLNRTEGKTLLLFKSYRDQEKARKILSSLNRKITFIDDSFEPETVQKYVESADIIMASASSRLWEGIDITDLKLEIIFSLPFIRPPVHLDKNTGFLFSKRKMLIRLQQGIGRLIRKENDCAICIILDNRLEKYKGSSHFSSKLRERIQYVDIKDILKRFKPDEEGGI